MATQLLLNSDFAAGDNGDWDKDFAAPSTIVIAVGSATISVGLAPPLSGTPFAANIAQTVVLTVVKGSRFRVQITATSLDTNPRAQLLYASGASGLIGFGSIELKVGGNTLEASLPEDADTIKVVVGGTLVGADLIVTKVELFQDQTAYTIRADIEEVHGKASVKQWADLDNLDDETAISDRITWASEYAFDRINAKLHQGAYTIPFEVVPNLIKNMAAAYAGVVLYDNRRVADTEETDEDFVDVFRLHFDQDIKDLLSGKLRLIDLQQNDSRVPAVGVF
jgi:phage gp36-like protein